MFGLPPLLAHAAELVTLALLVAICAGAGMRGLRWMGVERYLGAGERVAFGVLLGWGMLSFAVLAVGLLGLLYLPVLLLVLLALAAIGYSPLLGVARQARSAFERAWNGLHYPPNAFLAAVITIAVVASLVRALVPVATQDDLMYHLALPSRYIADHRVAFYPDSNYSLFPELMEMLYTAGLMLGSDRLPVLIAFSFGLLAPFCAALLARRLLSEEGGVWRILPLLIAALFLTVPLTSYIMRAANTDLAQASAEMLAVYAFYMAVTAAPRPNLPLLALLALSGVCGGLAFSVKFYGALVPAILGVTLLGVLVYRRRSGRLSAREIAAALATYGLPAAAIACVWLLRNFIASGNPVWPAAGSTFGGAYWTPAADPEMLLGRTPGLSGIGDALRLRWEATARPPISLDNNVYVVSLGPLLMPGMLALLLARWKRPLRFLFYVAAVLWLVSLPLFSRTSIRYLFTFFLFAAVLVGYSLVSAASRARLARVALGTALALSLGALALQAAASAGPYLPTTLTLDNAAEDRYLALHMDDYALTRYIASNTPPDSVIYVWDSIPRGYRIARPYIYARLIPGYSGISPDIEAWHARLKQLGVTHVLVHDRAVLAPTYPAGYDPDRATERALAARYFTPPLTTTYIAPPFAHPPGLTWADYTLYGLK